MTDTHIISRTVTAADVAMGDAVFEGVKTGRVGFLFQGPTAGCRVFDTGRFLLPPGMEPHPIHQHEEEELLIIITGTGEITCDGRVTRVGPGDTMYTAPHVPHGVKNTGDDEMLFLFIKWIGQKPGDAAART